MSNGSVTCFHLTDEHVQVLRRAVVSWDPAENGAPTIDPTTPLGGADIHQDILEILGGAGVDPITVHLELEQAFAVLLHVAELSPGHYDYPNRLKLKESTEDDVCDIRERCGVATTGLDLCSFEIEARHIKLLRHANVRWTDWGVWRGGAHEVPGLCPKRPYDDISYPEVAMALILGLAVDERDDAEQPLDSETERAMYNLHLTMQEATQVMLLHGRIDPGPHVLDSSSDGTHHIPRWRRAAQR